MERLTMLDKAMQLARDCLDGVSALSDAEYKELSALDDKAAVKMKAQRMLEEAAENVDEQ